MGPGTAAVMTSMRFTTPLLSLHASSTPMTTTIGKTKCTVARKDWWTSFTNCIAGFFSGIEGSALKASSIRSRVGGMDTTNWYAGVRTTLKMLLHCGVVREKKLPVRL